MSDVPGQVPIEARKDFVDGAVAELLLERWGPPVSIAQDRGGRRVSPPSRNLVERSFDAAAFATNPYVKEIWIYEHTHRGILRLRAPRRSFLVFNDGLLIGGWEEELGENGAWVEVSG